MAMTTFDFSPLFRSTIGFDRLARLMESAMEFDQAGNGYPPYNIEVKGENEYLITVAVAGFNENELSIEVRENTLTIAGRKQQDDAREAVYLYRGIAGRDFVRKFQLADYVQVKGAYLNNGLLAVHLVREVPEEMKPRKIEIKSEAPSVVSKAKKLIEETAKKVA